MGNSPLILASGLTPDNIKKAILEVRPAGVDSHTGVEDASGRKSREKSENSSRKRMKLLNSLRQDSDHLRMALQAKA